MTATILDLKCPACGHTMGQEEYERVVANFRKVVEEKSNGEIEQTKYECDKKLQDMHDQHKHNFDNEVNQRVALQNRDMEKRHRDELVEKVEEERQRVVSEEGRQREEDRTGYKMHIHRLEENNKVLTVKIEDQKKRLEILNSEFKGTRGEIDLLDALHNEFQNDELVPKIVGVEMADVIQTVIENGEKITPPIVWDRKTVNKVTTAHICQAKRYKTTHNTDYSIIVTEKDITTKDSDNTKVGIREGILLVHPSEVVEIAKLIRSFIIESAKQTSSNKDRTSKQAKLYDYLKSPEYTRTIETIRNTNSKLDNLQRLEEDYHKDTWAKRKKLIEESRKISEQNQQKINDIMQDPTSEDSEDEDKKEDE